jgi:hypothetical protein
MTAQLLTFPDRRDPIITAARAILRSHATHDSEIIREACDALMTWGDALDWSEGYHVKRALPVECPPYSPGTGSIRKLILASMIGAVGSWAVIAAVMVW